MWQVLPGRVNLVPYLSVLLCPNGKITYEVVSVEISPIVRHSGSLFRDLEKATDLFERPKDCVSRLSCPCRGT